MARVALVTGGTRGIGAAISKGLKDAGYKVAANYGGNDEAANQFKTETGIPVFKFDVSDAASSESGIRAVEAELGPVDILVNNAGITRDGMFHKMTYDQWSAVIRTNLDSMFTCTRPVIEGMRERGFGRVIIISSINGQKGQMGQANYSAAKAVPEEVLKSKILPLIPVGRLGEAEEIARSVLFLAADEAGFVTGSTLSVNGGQYMA
jgi:acetoacetyl-CoA reductase